MLCVHCDVAALSLEDRDELANEDVEIRITNIISQSDIVRCVLRCGVVMHHLAHCGRRRLRCVVVMRHWCIAWSPAVGCAISIYARAGSSDIWLLGFLCLHFLCGMPRGFATC
jgi:hypothetical protein